MKTLEEDAHTHHPRHQIFYGSNPMSYLCLATSKTPKNTFCCILYQDEYKYPKKMRIPTILDTSYFSDRNPCHICVRRPQKPSEIIFTLFCTKVNKNSRKRCTYPLYWAPGIFGIEADVIFCSATSKTPRNNFRYFIPR